MKQYKEIFNKSKMMFLSWRVNYIKDGAKQSSNVLRTKFPTRSSPIFVIMLSDTAFSQTVFNDNFSCISSNVFAYKALAHSDQCIHLCISEVYTKEFPHSRVTHTITNSGTHTKNVQPGQHSLPDYATPSVWVPRHHWRLLCVQAGSERARNPPVWSNSILISSNLNLSKRAGARVSSVQLFRTTSYHSLKYRILALLP